MVYGETPTGYRLIMGIPPPLSSALRVKTQARERSG